jgi:hypothetical protein
MHFAVAQPEALLAGELSQMRLVGFCALYGKSETSLAGCVF